MIFRILLFILLLAQIEVHADSEIITPDKKIYLSGVTYEFMLPPGKDSEYLIVQRTTTGSESFQILPVDTSDYGKVQQRFKVTFTSAGQWNIYLDNSNLAGKVRVIQGWLSILPPILAILLALLTRQVLVALFAGIWFGASIIFNYNPFTGFLETLTLYIGKAAADPERMAILIFSLTLGGMVGVISKSGGTQGIVEFLSRYAKSARTAQLATWAMGVLVFFDDYANTLIVGNTMRPLTDRLKISREKLAYLVDSTAAPVATIAIISTWIGYQLSLIADAFRTLGLPHNAYITFFKTIPYNFYPIFALAFGFFIAYFGRDLFRMHKAEVRARRGAGLLDKNATPIADLATAELNPKENIPRRWYNGIIPIAVVVLVTLIGLWFTGLNALRQTGMADESAGLIQYISLVIGKSNSFDVLMWSAFTGSITAIVLALVQRILSLNEAILAWVSGVKAMIMASLILILAWAIGNICKDMQTAEFVITVSEGILSPRLLPVITFLLAGLIAFSTGTSWGTMAILTPIVIPLAHELPLAQTGISPELQSSILLSSIASILAGAAFGDHCSPISDTTIMSSMASGSDHIDHVRTQLPYALIVGFTSIILGYLPVGFGVSPWWGIFFWCNPYNCVYPLCW